MERLAWAAAAVLVAFQFAGPVGAVPLDRLEARYRSLTIDGTFDAVDAESLISLALSDDLLFSRQEAEFIAQRLKRHDVQDVEPPVADAADGPVVTRARRLMVQALGAGIGGTDYRRAMQQLIALAMAPDLTREERFRTLELVDRYRRVDPAVSTRDALEAIALLLTNPTEARLAREHRRQLELLERQFQVPILLPAASSSGR